MLKQCKENTKSVICSYTCFAINFQTFFGVCENLFFSIHEKVRIFALIFKLIFQFYGYLSQQQNMMQVFCCYKLTKM